MNQKLRMRGTEEIARRWHALAERRRAHLTDLHDSGRWRKYYREHNLLRHMHETARMAEAWNKLASAGATRPIIVAAALRPLAASRRF